MPFMSCFCSVQHFGLHLCLESAIEVDLSQVECTLYHNLWVFVFLCFSFGFLVLLWPGLEILGALI